MKLVESASFGTKALRVDRENQVIFGVKVIGEESRNGKVFPAATRRAAHALIEGLKVNVNHRKMGEEAMVASRLGRFRNPREEADGTYADLHYLASNPVMPMLIEAAERDPGLFGISILGSGKGTKKDDKGRKIVEQITGLESADLVSDPANTNGLHESTATIQVAEAAAVESAESCEVMLGKLIGKLIEEERHDEADAHMKVHKKHAAKKDEGGGEGEAEEETPETKESVRRANCLSLCESLGVEPAPALVAALVASKPKVRSNIIERWSGRGAEAPKSGVPAIPADEIRESAPAKAGESSLERIMSQIRK